MLSGKTVAEEARACFSGQLGHFKFFLFFLFFRPGHFNVCPHSDQGHFLDFAMNYCLTSASCRKIENTLGKAVWQVLRAH